MKTTQRIIIIGFGSIGQALLPLLTEKFNAEIIIFDKETDRIRRDIAQEFSATLINKAIDQNNYTDILSPLLSNSSFLLNLAVSVSSLDLIDLTQRFDTLYLDTSIEPWDYDNTDHGLISNYELRERLKEYVPPQKRKTTAIVAHGANPGFISILLKKALLEMATANNLQDRPTTQFEWAKLSEKLEIQVIQISERDSQVTSKKREPSDFFALGL